MAGLEVIIRMRRSGVKFGGDPGFDQLFRLSARICCAPCGSRDQRNCAGHVGTVANSVVRLDQIPPCRRHAAQQALAAGGAR